MEKRAERVAKRDKFTVEEALQMLKEKEAKTKGLGGEIIAEIW